MFSGVEYYLLLFFEKIVILFDYFYFDIYFVLYGDVNDVSEFFWVDVFECYE